MAFAEKNAAPDSSKPRGKTCCVAKGRREGKLGLFYLDESGFSNIPNVQRAKGKPHMADASAARQGENVAGALGYATGKLWHGQMVKRIAQREQRMPLTLVVLDNARAHHNFDPKKLDGWLWSNIAWSWCASPYSPEPNPIEIVWKQAKHYKVRR